MIVHEALLRPTKQGGLEYYFKIYFDDLLEQHINKFDKEDDYHYGEKFYNHLPFEFKMFMGHYFKGFEYLKYYFSRHYNLPVESEPYFACKRFLQKNPNYNFAACGCRHSEFHDDAVGIRCYFYDLIGLVNNYENIVKEREKWEYDHLHWKPKEFGSPMNYSFTSSIGKLIMSSRSGNTLKLYDEMLKLLRSIMVFMELNHEKLSNVLDEYYPDKPCEFTLRFKRIDKYVLI